MAGYRAERLAELIHKELAHRLRVEIKDERLGDVSITHVDLNRDLSRATVYYLPLGGGEPDQDMVDALDDAARVLRGPIGRALRVRHSPELVFELDTHTVEAFRVSELLDRIRDERLEEEE